MLLTSSIPESLTNLFSLGNSLTRTEITMSFIFMDNAAIDRKSRKLIRSHVAKGKNLGRVLAPRRKRCEVGVKAIMPIRDDRGEEGTLSIERQFGDGLSVYPIPNKLPPGSRSLVQRG